MKLDTTVSSFESHTILIQNLQSMTPVKTLTFPTQHTQHHSHSFETMQKNYFIFILSCPLNFVHFHPLLTFNPNVPTADWSKMSLFYVHTFIFSLSISLSLSLCVCLLVWDLCVFGVFFLGGGFVFVFFFI